MPGGRVLAAEKFVTGVSAPTVEDLRRQARRVLRVTRVAIALLLALAVAGCGQKSLMTEPDVNRFGDWSKSYQQVAVDMLGLSTALAGQDAKGARQRVDALEARLAASDKHAAAVANPDVQELLTDYMAKTRRAVDSLAAIVDALERERRPSEDALREVEVANAEMFEADEDIVERVLEHTPLVLRERVEQLAPSGS